MMKIARELGELAGAVEIGLIDKRFSRQELAEAKKEAWDLIVQAVKFYRMVEE